MCLEISFRLDTTHMTTEGVTEAIREAMTSTTEKEEATTSTTEGAETTSTDRELDTTTEARPEETTTTSEETTTTSEEDTTTTSEETTTTSEDDTTTISEDETTTTSEEPTTTSEEMMETSTMLGRGQRQLDLDSADDPEATTTEKSEEEDSEEEKDSGPSDLIGQLFGRYFNRLKRIYELDIQLLEQISVLLTRANEDVLPSVQTAVEPLLMSTGIENANLLEVAANLATVLRHSDIEVSVRTKMEQLNFVNVGQYSQKLLKLSSLCCEYGRSQFLTNPIGCCACA